MEASGPTRETFASHPMSSGWIAPMPFPPEAYAPGNKFGGPGYGVPYMLLPGGIPPGQVFIGPAPGPYNLVPDQQPRPRLGNVFFKTRVCNKWRNGCCPYGDRCTYAHGEHELRTLPPELLAQLGALQIGGVAAPPPMTPMMPQSRAHVPVAPRVYAAAAAPPGRAGAVYAGPPPLQAFMPVAHPHMVRHSPAASASDGAPVSPAAGSLSPRGARQDAIGHPYYKTRLCIRYVQLGHCPRGAHCSYAHGYEELRARSSSSSGPPGPMHVGGQWVGQGPASRPGSGSPPSTTLSSSVAPSTERTLEVLPNAHLPSSPRAALAEGNNSMSPGSPTSKKQDTEEVGEGESRIDDQGASHGETEEEAATGRKDHAG